MKKLKNIKQLTAIFYGCLKFKFWQHSLKHEQLKILLSGNKLIKTSVSITEKIP